MVIRKSLSEAKDVTLPATIPCAGCKIPKPPSSFSPVRLDDLRQYVVQARKNGRTFDPKVGQFIRCSMCVGGPAVEFKCYHCNVTFPRTDRYVSKNMLKNRKDEALCWKCSQDEQNDTLSSSESDQDSDGSEGSFVTNPYTFNDDESVVSMSNMTMSDAGVSLGTSKTANESSGGVSLAGKSVGGTIYGGTSASTASSSRGPFNVLTAGRRPAAPISPSATASATSDTRSVTSNTTGGGFNRNVYSAPVRPPSPSRINVNTGKSGWAKISAGPKKVDMDSVRQQTRAVRRTAAAQANDLQVEDSSDSDDDGPVASNPRSSRRAVDSDDDDAPFDG